CVYCFFFSSRRRHTRFSRDWSSDVCSSDLITDPASTEGIAAVVDRILSFGHTARVELDGANGASGQHFEVVVPVAELQNLQLVRGQQVRLRPAQLKLFERHGEQHG